MTTQSTNSQDEHYQLTNKLCDTFYEQFNPGQMSVKTFASMAAEYIQANYLLRIAVVEAIGEDETGLNTEKHWSYPSIRNRLRQEIRQQLNLQTNQQSEKE